jgi:site-specific recombinase XerC
MYREPQIVHNNSCKSRSYVKVLISGIRYRFYNGKDLGIHCYPNHTSNPVERLRLLKQMEYELRKKLESGWRPGYEPEELPVQNLPLKKCIEDVLDSSKEEDISDRYRNDMERIGTAFIEHLRAKSQLKLTLKQTSPQLLETFLQSYTTSGTYYMTQRSNLAGIFTRMVRKGLIAENPVYKTSLKRKVPMLNAIFTKEQLRNVLSYLEGYNNNLYLCALMMYGCFLRPHREIRLLKRKHLNKDCTTISLSGSENKSKRIRIIRLPNYVTTELQKQELHLLPEEAYLMTRTIETFNGDYFKTLWTRAKQEMLRKRMVNQNHTLYSFRHTGAVAVYQKTKDPYKVQKAMFHSSLTVTLVYLRSLGLMIDNNLDDLPEL